MPCNSIPATPGGRNTPKVTQGGAVGNTPPSIPREIGPVRQQSHTQLRLIETHGRDMRFCAGVTRDASNALAINPAAPACLVYGAAMSQVADIRALTAPLGFLSDDLVESIPATVMRDFIDAINGLANVAEKLLEHAGALSLEGAARQAPEGMGAANG